MEEKKDDRNIKTMMASGLEGLKISLEINQMLEGENESKGQVHLKGNMAQIETGLLMIIDRYAELTESDTIDILSRLAFVYDTSQSLKEALRKSQEIEGTAKEKAAFVESLSEFFKGGLN